MFCSIPRFYLCHVLLRQQTISHMRKRFTEWVHCVGRMNGMNIVRVNIECFTGCKRIKQRRMSFVLGYLRMILWKTSTAISVKHRILATFNIKKNNSDSLYAFKLIILSGEGFPRAQTHRVVPGWWIGEPSRWLSSYNTESRQWTIVGKWTVTRSLHS